MFVFVIIAGITYAVIIAPIDIIAAADMIAEVDTIEIILLEVEVREVGPPKEAETIVGVREVELLEVEIVCNNRKITH